MSQCLLCGKSSEKIAGCLQFCYSCLRDHFPEIHKEIDTVHAKIRRAHDLPTAPPQDLNNPVCTLCVNSCRIPAGARGYCGVRTNREGKIHGGTAGIFIITTTPCRRTA